MRSALLLALPTCIIACEARDMAAPPAAPPGTALVPPATSTPVTESVSTAAPDADAGGMASAGVGEGTSDAGFGIIGVIGHADAGVGSGSWRPSSDAGTGARVREGSTASTG